MARNQNPWAVSYQKAPPAVHALLSFSTFASSFTSPQRDTGRVKRLAGGASPGGSCSSRPCYSYIGMLACCSSLGMLALFSFLFSACWCLWDIDASLAPLLFKFFALAKFALGVKAIWGWAFTGKHVYFLSTVARSHKWIRSNVIRHIWSTFEPIADTPHQLLISCILATKRAVGQ